MNNLSESFRRESFKFFQAIEEKCKCQIKSVQDSLCKCGELNELIKDFVSQLTSNLDVKDHLSFVVQDYVVKMSRQVKIHVENFLELTKRNKEIWKNDDKAITDHLEKCKQEVLKSFKNKTEKIFLVSKIDG